MRPKICVVVPAFTNKQTLENVQTITDADIIEIRFDFRVENINIKETRKASNLPLIATNRCLTEGGFSRDGEKDRIQLLLSACKEGFEYSDIELVSHGLPEIVETIKEEGAKCIVSHHDFEKTPSLNELDNLFQRAKRAGADLAKLIGTSNSYEDNVEYLNFLRKSPGNISYGMGAFGVISRLVSPMVGGAFTYASSEDGKESAPGQLTLSRMRSIYEQIGVNV
jgi:3-dehydroquinate dehydratase-1